MAQGWRRDGAGMAQGWRSDESARLPPMWPGFDSMWPGLGVICGMSLLLVLVLAPRGFSPGPPFFLPSSKTNISKFQFDLEFEGHRFVSHTTVKCHPR